MQSCRPNDQKPPLYFDRSFGASPYTGMRPCDGLLSLGSQWQRKISIRHPRAKSLSTQIKAVFLRYLDHNKPFHTYCDASALQLGAAICQDVLFSQIEQRTPKTKQKNYTVGE
jgi:lipopolysaccharide biosynthesis glycosyltransferase